MLEPGLVQKCFHVQTRIGGVLKQLPANGSVPQPGLTQRLDGFEEIRPARRVDSVLYGHQHRAMLQLDAGHSRHLRPMSGWIKTCPCVVRQSEAYCGEKFGQPPRCRRRQRPGYSQVIRHDAPQHTAHRHPTKKYKEVDGHSPCLDPAWHRRLSDGVQCGEAPEPGRSSCQEGEAPDAKIW